MANTIVNIVGFDTGDDSEKYSSSTGTPNFSSAITHVGAGYSIHSKLTDALWRRRFWGGNGGANKSVGFALYVDTAANGGGAVYANILKGFVSATNYEIQLHLVPTTATDFRFEIWDDAGVTGSSAESGDISVDGWHWVELYWEHATSSADAYLYVDGVEEIAFTNRDFNANFGTNMQYEIEGGQDGWEFYIDSFYCGEGLTDKTDLLGEHGLFPMSPDETTATPDYASTNYGPTALSTGAWDDLAIISEVDTVTYTGASQGGTDGLTLSGTMTGNPIAFKGIWRAKGHADFGLQIKHYGVYGHSGGTLVNSELTALTGAFSYESVLDLTAGNIPTQAQELRLGLEQGATGTPSIVSSWPRNIGSASAIDFTVSNDKTEGNLMVCIIGKDDDTATTQPGGWTLLTGFESNNAIYLEVWYKVITATDATQFSYTWTGDSESYIGLFMEIRGTNDVPVLLSSASDIGSSAAPATASFTANNANSLILAGCSSDRDALPSLSATLDTELYEARTGTGAGDTGIGVGTLAPGSTTVPALTHSLSKSEEWTAFVIELQPGTTDYEALEVAYAIGHLFAPMSSAGTIHNGTATAEGIAVVTAAGSDANANVIAKAVTTASATAAFTGSATAAGVADITATASQFGNILADATATAIADVTATGTQLVLHEADATATAIADVSSATASVVLGVTDVRLSGFAFRKHFGREQEHRPMQPQDTNIDAIMDVDYALRLLIENQGGADATIQRFNLEYKKNAGGTWTQVSTTSNEVKSNADSVRFSTGPLFVGDAYSDQWTSRAVEFIEAPFGVIHKITYEWTTGICGSQNKYYLKYQRSTNRGNSWTSSKDLIGEGWSHADNDCIQSRFRGLQVNKAGDDMYVWYYDTLNDATVGTYGAILRSTDEGATWSGQQPMGPHGSQPLDFGGGDISTDRRFVMAENGDLYFVNSGKDYDGTSSRYLLALYKSTNQGSSWTYSEIINEYLATGGVDKIWRLYGFKVDRNTGKLYVVHRDGDNMYLHKGTSGGGSWTTKHSTLWTFGSADATYTWPRYGGYDIKECLHIHNSGTIYVNYNKKAADGGAYVVLKISDDEGATWQDGGIGPQSGASDQNTDYAVITSSIPDSIGHTDKLVASFGQYRTGTGIGSSFNETGPIWYESEDGAIWTGPHHTRVADDQTYYQDLYDAGGYVANETHFQTKANILPLVDKKGNVHVLFGMQVSYPSMRGVKAYYDADPVYLNLNHTNINDLAGQAGSSFDTLNHGYSWDGTLGPNRLRGLTYQEADIVLRPDSGFLVNTDYLEFRINGITNDVVPRMTMAANEKVWPGTTGTIVTAGSIARGIAEVSCSAVPSYKAAGSPSLPHLISSGNHIIPKGRKSGPFYNYEDDTYYAVLYHTGPTEIQVHRALTDRDSTWVGQSSTIAISAADSVWAEQGKYGYEHMIYIAVQEDSTGDVDFYEFNTTTDTLSTVVNLHSPSPAPLIACVSIAVRNNSGTPQIVVGYQGQRDATLSTQRCTASIRDCGGSTWTHSIAIDGRSDSSTYHWLAPTLVEGSNGLVHCWFCTGPVNVANTDGIWAKTLRTDNTLSTLVGIAGVTSTSSSLNTDYEPPGQAVTWHRDEDATEVRLAVCYQDTAEIDAVAGYESDDGDIDFRSPNLLIMVADDAQNFKDGTYDTANMVMIADDKDAPPQLNHRFMWVTDTWQRVDESYDEEPYIYPGYSGSVSVIGLPSVSRVQKLSASYVYPGAGGVYIGMIYEEPSGVYYAEKEIIPSADQGPVTHNATSTATGIAEVLYAVPSIAFSSGASADGIADVSTVDATVVLYDPIKLASATATGVAAVTAPGAGEFAGTATATAKAVTLALGGFQFVDTATSSAAATVIASPTIIRDALPAESPINVLVVRDGIEGVEESVQDDLITSVVVAIERGRNIIDEEGHAVKEMSLTVVYNNNFRSGQLIHVQDSLRGLLHVGKITSVSHNVAKHAGLAVTSLEVRVPVEAQLTRKPTFELVTVAAEVLIDGVPATIEFTVDTAGTIYTTPTTVTINGVDATIATTTNTFVSTTPAVITATGATANIQADTRIDAVPASITLTGADASVQADTAVDTGSGSLTVTGEDAVVQTDTDIPTTPASFTITGADAEIQEDLGVVTTPASITVTGEDATITYATNITTTAAGITVTGQNAIIVQGDNTDVTTTPATVTLTGQNAIISEDTEIDTTAATVTLTGADAEIQEDTAVLTTPATVTFTGSDATVQEDTAILTTPANITLTGEDAEIGLGTLIDTIARQITVIGQTAEIQSDTSVDATAAGITLTGQDATITAETVVVTTAATITLTGQDALIEENSGPTDVTTTPATVTFTAVDPTIARNNDTNVNSVAATITLQGQDATIEVSTIIETTAASITVTGVNATINAETDVDSSPATITFTPVDPSITRT